jgi:tetratricopeptide (TPR) repeat protein
LKTGVPNIELAKVYNNRGNIYARKNLFDNSIADFNRAIELNQYYSDAYFNRANVYYKLKKFYNAISDYNQVIKINPYDIKAYKNRAICYFLTEDYEKAYEDICKIQNLGYSSDPILTDIITKLKRIKK